MKPTVFGHESKFVLGKQTTSLNDVFGLEQLQKIRSKFQEISEEEFYTASLETLRYLYLAAYSDGELFFTGSKLVDDIWHCLITETEFYRAFCDRLRPNTFIEHSGEYSDDCGHRFRPIADRFRSEATQALTFSQTVRHQSSRTSPFSANLSI